MGNDLELIAPTIPLMNKKSQKMLGDLNYEFIDLTNTQKRLFGCKALKPQIDIDDYTTRAVIDWIDIRVLLNRRTQFHWLQRDIENILGKKVHITNSLTQPNDPDDLFDIRFQEPEIETLRKIFSEIKTRYGLGMDPVVAGMEISIDFYPKTASDLERAKMVRVLSNHILVEPDMISDHRDRPRAVWGTKTGSYQKILAGNADFSEGANRELLIATDWDHPPYADATVVIGAKEADVRWRIMDKVIDTQNRDAGTYEELPEKDRRARIEVTLNRTEMQKLGVQHFDDLIEFNFSSFQGRYFRFFLPTFSGRVVHKTVWREAITVARDRYRMIKFRSNGGVGLQAMDQARAETQNVIRKQTLTAMHNSGLKLPLRKRIATGSSQTFVAYKELNERVLTALRNLGKRVHKGFL